jgi:hypothetical protein
MNQFISDDWIFFWQFREYNLSGSETIINEYFVTNQKMPDNPEHFTGDSND